MSEIREIKNGVEMLEEIRCAGEAINALSSNTAGVLKVVNIWLDHLKEVQEFLDKQAREG